MNTRLLTNLTTDTHVDLPSGKISKTGVRKPIKQQKGMACTLFAMRRITFFNTGIEDNKALQAYKLIKLALMEFGNDTNALLTIGINICKDFDIDIEKNILKNKSFMEKYFRIKPSLPSSMSPGGLFNRLSSFDQWVVIYDILIETVLAPLMNLKNTDWHPRDGINALKDSLRVNGAHFFMGKFGFWCYNKPPKKFTSECTRDRHIFSFDKNAYVGDSRPFTHGIIVDQIKTVNGKEMVFFRDPYTQSKEGQPEKIFMLSYETFIQRLTDRQGYRVARNECASDLTFGMTSRCPENLYGPGLGEPIAQQQPLHLSNAY